MADAVESLKPIIPTTPLTGAAVNLYTAPSQQSNMIVKVCAIKLSNTDTVARIVTIYNVPLGGSPAVGNQLWPGVTIPANTLWESDSDTPYGLFLVPAGGSIQAFADVANKVNITVHGAELSG